MEQWDGGEGIPSTLVSDRLGAGAPTCLLQFSAQSLVHGEHAVDIVECMSHLLEAFQMWREQKAP